MDHRLGQGLGVGQAADLGEAFALFVETEAIFLGEQFQAGFLFGQQHFGFTLVHALGVSIGEHHLANGIGVGIDPWRNLFGDRRFEHLGGYGPGRLS